jgi:hypothetical protein
MAGSVAVVIRSAEDRLRTARFGDAVVFGRMVTFALQNLRSVVPEFDGWYQAKQEEMKSDPLMRYFYQLRTKIETQVGRHTSSSVHIKQLFNNFILGRRAQRHSLWAMKMVVQVGPS